MAVKKEGFASRWSRRKQEVAQETDSVVEEIAVEEKIVIDEEMLAEQRLEKLNTLTDDDMPDIETLNEDSDFSGFMSTGVSETLRKMALQKLFHGKSYNVRDGLDEYDGDYTNFKKLDPSVITCDMKHLIEVEAEKIRLAEEAKKKEELLQTKANDVDIAEQELEREGELELEVTNGEDNLGESKSMSENVAVLDKSDLNESDEGIAERKGGDV